MDFDPRFHHPEVKEVIKDNNPHNQSFKELLKSLTLTHSATVSKADKSKNNNDQMSITYKSLYKDEEAQLNFAKTFDYYFAQRNNKVITILC